MYESSYSFPGMLPEPKPVIKIKKHYSDEILPREWQTEAFLEVLDKNALIQAFCGSGKSVLGIMCASADAVRNQRKQIVIVPQKHIGDGFLSHGKYFLPRIGHVEYCSPFDFCDDSDLKIRNLISFLISPFTKLDSIDNIPIIDKCCAVATHFSFNMAMNYIIKNNKKIGPLSVIVDEAHHIKSRGVVGFDANKLGENINYLHEDSRNKFLLLSATPHLRSDRGNCTPSNNFLYYKLDFIDHFKTLNIKNVEVNFIEYEDLPIMIMIKNIVKESVLKDGKYYPKNHHLVIVPPKNSKWRKNYDEFLSRFFQLFYEFFPENIVLDLVDAKTQSKNKKILLQQPKKESNGSQIKITVLCRLGREGTDWCACDRIHNLSIEGKDGSCLAVQTFGRAFRKFKGKTNVKLFYYVKKFITLDESTTKREFISERLNAILALMLIDDLFAPIELPYFVSEHKDGKNKLVRKNITLREIYGESQYDIIKKDIFNNIFQIEMTEKNIDPFIRSIIRKNEMLIEVDENIVVEAFKCLILRAKSKQLRKSHFSIGELRTVGGFDCVVEKEGIGGNFYCGKLNAKSFEKYRKLISSKLWSEEEQEQIAENILEVLSETLGRPLIEKDKKNIDSFIEDLQIYHSSYSKLPLNSFTFDCFYKNLKISNKNKTYVCERIKQINRVLPEGHHIKFDLPSNLVNKISYYKMGA